jgi:hypothetical protein
MKTQSDLNKLFDKCETITLSRTCYPVEFSYMLCGTVLVRVSSINNVEDEKHIDVRVGKVFAMLGTYQKTVIRVQRSIHFEVSLHVFSSSEAGVCQLCMEFILGRACGQGGTCVEKVQPINDNSESCYSSQK